MPGTVTHDNLGGQGPDDSGEPTLVYSNVAILNGNRVDLVIQALGDYQRADSENGFMNGQQIAKIMQAPDSTVTLEFRLVDGVSGAPVVLDHRAFTFFDIDGNPHRDLKETLEICGGDGFQMTENSLLTVTNQDGACTTFEPSTDNGYTNPKWPHDLTELQAAHSVSVYFRQLSSFRITAGFKGDGKHARPLLFAGMQAIGENCNPA